MFKKLLNGSTGTVSGPTVTVTPSMPFDQMAAEQNAKRAAALAERQAAGDPSQLAYVDPQNVMNTALMTGTGVNMPSPGSLASPGSLPSNGWQPSTRGANYTPVPTGLGFKDSFKANPYAPAPSAIPPPPSGASRPKRNDPGDANGTGDFMTFGGRRLLCKSKKGGKKVVRRSASGKRCRRKAKRSRKAHRR